MRMMVWLGGPFHGMTDWVFTAQERVVLGGTTKYTGGGFYKYAFGDDYIDVYYWNLNDYQTNAIRQQVTQLRVRAGEIVSFTA